MEEPAPTFDEFMASLTSASQGEGLTVSSELYHEFFAASEEGRGARASIIASLPRPTSLALKKVEEDATCPVCLQTLSAITTEEEYALASDHYFGDIDSLGLRVMPCEGGHVVCARCTKAWLQVNNSCPLCRAQVDPQAPGVSDTIENQRHVERMLALFHDLFGRGHGSGPGLGGNREEKKEDRSAYSGMYS